MEYHRHTIRLSKYNYSDKGLYFVTVGSYKHAYFWGEIKNNEFIPSGIGKIIDKNLNALLDKFDIQIMDYQIMPNHLHMILRINSRGLIYQTPKNGIDILKTCKHMGLINQTPTLGQIIRFLKARSTYEINQNGGVAPPLFKNNWKYLFEGHIFQRNYYERIIRDEKEYFERKKYIELNPLNWQFDKNKNV